MVKAVKRADRALVRQMHGRRDPSGTSTLHEMRMAAKRLRYTAEALRPVRPRQAKRLVKQVKAVQDLLGEPRGPRVTARGGCAACPNRAPAVEKVARVVNSGGEAVVANLVTEWPELTEALAALLAENGKSVPDVWKRPRSGKVW